MKLYLIEVTETLQKTISVEAQSKTAALNTLKKRYKDSDIVLDSEDYVNTNFKIIED